MSVLESENACVTVRFCAIEVFTLFPRITFSLYVLVAASVLQLVDVVKDAAATMVPDALLLPPVIVSDAWKVPDTVVISMEVALCQDWITAVAPEVAPVMVSPGVNVPLEVVMAAV